MTDRFAIQIAAATAPARPWTVRGAPVRQAAPAPAPAPVATDTRYVVNWLDNDGMMQERVRLGPSDGLFTGAFAALARGGLVQTPDGLAAVEDLLPGDRVVTAAGIERLLWKGSRIVAPQHAGVPLYRISADALGPGRPMPDLLLGPAARIVSRRSSIETLVGASAALVPVAALADGEAIVRVRPISALQVFHLGFRRHVTFAVNGVEMDSVHPGAVDAAASPELRAHFLSMFPHLDGMEDFGRLAMHRLEGDLLDRLTRIS
jgi:hypothetical protein